MIHALFAEERGVALLLGAATASAEFSQVASAAAASAGRAWRSAGRLAGRSPATKDWSVLAGVRCFTW